MNKFECYLCGNNCGFFVWSTTRQFPIDKLMKMKKVKGKAMRNKLCIEGVKVCFSCYNKLIEE